MPDIPKSIETMPDIPKSIVATIKDQKNCSLPAMSSSSRNVDYFFQEQECMMEISECQFIIGTVIGVLLLIAGIET
ncbi:MAG: hypothetical protein WB988_03245, partial [Candidatus Nitrosopolaris sp.]